MSVSFYYHKDTFWLYFFWVNCITVPSERPQNKDYVYLLDPNLIAVILVFYGLLVEGLLDVVLSLMLWEGRRKD